MRDHIVFDSIVYRLVKVPNDPSFDGILYVSNDGDVFHTKRRAFLKQYPDRVGYLTVRFQHEGKVRGFLVHRLVGFAWLPSQEGKPEINHIDLNKTNNHVDNLEWCNRSENIRHAVEHGAMKSEKKTYCFRDLLLCKTEEIKGVRTTSFDIYRAMETSVKGLPHIRRYAAWDPDKTPCCPITDEEYLEYTRSDECPIYVIEHVWSKPVVFTSFHALADISDHNDERSTWAFITNAIAKGNIKRYKNTIQKLADWKGDRKDLTVAGDEGVSLEVARMKKPYLLGVEPDGKMTLYLDGHRRVPDMEESAVLRAIKQDVPTRWGRRYYVFATIDAMAKFIALTYPNNTGRYSIVKVGSNPMTCEFELTTTAGSIYVNEYAKLVFYNKE